MTWADIEARIQRFDTLTRGLVQEELRWKGGNDPLLYQERVAYLKAVHDILAGTEAARVVLLRASQRRKIVV